MKALTNVFGRLSEVNTRRLRQRESLLQRKRERFLSIHNADTPPAKLLAPPPRRLRCGTTVVGLWLLLILLFGSFVLGKPIIRAFQAIELREHDTQQWVARLTARLPTNEREAHNQKLAREVGDLEAASARELRQIMVLAAMPAIVIVFAFPFLLTWLFAETRHLLRNGAVARAEFVSRRLWPSSARLRFATTDGTRIQVIAELPPYVPIGTKLWVLYSPHNPKRALVYNPNSGFAELLTK